MHAPAQVSGARIIGRYALYDEIAAGGMAAVHVGRLLGPAGFSRTVAIKRLHPQFSRDPEFVSMFLDEARLAARIRHPNVVGTLDVVALAGELFLVMEYVQGESLSRLMKLSSEAQQRVPLRVISSILVGALDGLHAAHEATSDHGEPLGIVHRDVSPHNLLVGADGVSRVLDFGVAKATGRVQTTRDGQVKGKLSYMAPEQITGVVDRRTDVYAASVVLWEVLAGRRLFFGDNDAKTLSNVLAQEVRLPSELWPEVPPELDALTMKGLATMPDDRFATAREMARALERVIPPAPACEVGDWVEAVAGVSIATRAKKIASIESATSISDIRIEDDGTPSGIGFGTPSGPPKLEVVPRPEAARSRIVPLAAMAVGLMGLAGLVAWLEVGDSSLPRRPHAPLALASAALATKTTPTRTLAAESVETEALPNPVAPAPTQPVARPKVNLDHVIDSRK